MAGVSAASTTRASWRATLLGYEPTETTPYRGA